MQTNMKWVAGVVVFLLLLYTGRNLVVRMLVERVMLANVPPPEVRYPPAPPMPPVVGASMTELLQKIEAHLKATAPKQLDVLQPGLTDEQLAKIEQDYKIEIPADLKALYKWHNGCVIPKNGAPPAGNTPVVQTHGPVPGHFFLPLDESLRQKAELESQLKNETEEHRHVYDVLLSHRSSWISLISDGAGDGYYFDPRRKESEGAFFFNFNETGDYVFFPSIKNVFAAVEKCYASGVFQTSKTVSGEIEEDFTKSQPIWLEFGAAPKRSAP